MTNLCLYLYLCLHLCLCFYILPFTFYLLHFTFYVLPFTFYLLHFTFYVLPFTFTFYLCLRLCFYLYLCLYLPINELKPSLNAKIGSVPLYEPRIHGLFFACKKRPWLQGCLCICCDTCSSSVRTWPVS